MLLTFGVLEPDHPISLMRFTVPLNELRFSVQTRVPTTFGRARNWSARLPTPRASYWIREAP
jgi:hypothetical protein